MLEIFEPGALNYFTLFHLIPLTLSVSRNLILIYLPLSGFLDSLHSDRTHSRPGILSPDATHTSSGVIFVRQGLSFSELSTSSLSSLDPYSDYVGVNISLNNSSSVLFLNCTPPPLFALPRHMAEPTPFLSPFSPSPEISSFWGTSTAITPSGTQEVLPTLMGRKYSTGSSLLTSSLLMTLTHPPFSIAPLAVTTPLTSFLLPPLLLPGNASGPGFSPPTNSSICPSLFGLYPQTSVPLSSTFRKLAGMTLPPTVRPYRNTRLFLFPLLLLSSLLWH